MKVPILLATIFLMGCVSEPATKWVCDEEETYQDTGCHYGYAMGEYKTHCYHTHTKTRCLHKYEVNTTSGERTGREWNHTG